MNASSHMLRNRPTIWYDVNLHASPLSSVMNHVHHSCLSLIWGCTEGASLSLQANEPCSRIHLQPLHDEALLTLTDTLYQTPGRGWVCTHTPVQLARDHMLDCEMRVSMSICVCAHGLSLILSINHIISQSRQSCQAELAGGPADRC